MTTPNDREVLELSNDMQGDELTFASRQEIWINDTNGGSYGQNGQIVFDLSQLKNNQQSINFKDSLLTIPNIIEATLATPLGAAVPYNDFLVMPKNGSFNCIENISINIDGVEVSIAAQHLAPYLHYKMLNQAGSNDLSSVLQSYNYYPDTPDSIQFQPAATTANTPFLGEANNSVIGGTNYNQFLNGWNGYQAVNDGRNRRLAKSNFNTANNTAANALTTGGFCQTVNKDYVKANGTMATPNQYCYMLIIKLGFLHDVFEKLPLISGANIKMTINTNLVSTCVINYAYAASTTSTTPYSITSITPTTPYNKLPFQVSQPVGVVPYVDMTTGPATNAGPGNVVSKPVNSWGVSANNTLTINSYIAKSATINTGSAFQGINAARLCLISYTFTPEAQIKYLTLHSQPKRVVYNDVQTVLLTSSMTSLTGAQSAIGIQNLLTSNLARVKALLIVPYIAASSNGGISPLNSPFTGTNIAPYVKWTGMNVNVNGSPHFRTSQNYGFEHFIQEIKQYKSINGSETLGLSSGLLSQHMWETGYPYFFVDLTRADDLRDINVAKSYQIVGNVMSPVALDLYCYLIYDREFKIDVKSGQLST